MSEFYEEDFVTCQTCSGEGFTIVCFDDMCIGQGFCIHGDGEEVCGACGGSGEVNARG